MKKYKIDGVFMVDDNGNVRSLAEFEAPGDFLVGGLMDAASFVKNYGTEIKEPVTYKVGDRFRNSHFPGVFILVALADGDGVYRCATMIGDDNFSFGETVMIGNYDAIAQEELKKLGGRISTFTKIEDDE